MKEKMPTIAPVGIPPKTGFVRGRTHEISMQEVSEAQRCEQYCNSAQKVKNSHVPPSVPGSGLTSSL
jgi:hypothetical protein